MSEDSTNRYFIIISVTVSFFALFCSMYNTDYDFRYSDVDIPDKFTAGEVWLTNITDSVNMTLVNGDNTFMFGEVKVIVTLSTYFDTMFLQEQTPSWWVFYDSFIMNPASFMYDDIIDDYTDVENGTIYIVKGKYTNYRFGFYYNQTAYSNMTDALNSDDVDLYVGINDDDYIDNRGFWDFVMAMIFFDSPTGNNVIDSFIGIIMWSMISLVVYKFVTGIIPTLGG